MEEFKTLISPEELRRIADQLEDGNSPQEVTIWSALGGVTTTLHLYAPEEAK
jgi:hypothetical protein